MKLSVQTEHLPGKYGFREGYRLIREAGFEAVDWNIDMALDRTEVKKSENLKGLTIFEASQEEIHAHFREELEAIAENGLEITQAHAPFPAYFTGREDVLEYMIGVYQNIIRFCDSIGCKNLIIHGISRHEDDKVRTPEEYRALNMHLYESLIPTLQETKQITVCLENLFVGVSRFGRGFWEGCCSDAHMAAEWIDSLNAKAGKRCFGLCLDTGHLNLLRKPFDSYMPILGERIVALHIHDNTQASDSHMMPYTGSIDWSEFLTQLKNIGYRGDLSFETFAQTAPGRLPGALLPLFLRTVAGIGEYFRTQLLG